MNLNTHPENRKEMVKAISEHIEVRAQYMGIPTYAFVIGPLTVNRDGSISCEHPEFLDALKPMLIEHGWLDAEAEAEAPAEAPADSKEIPEDTEPIRVAQMEITMPVENWTVAQLTNLLRTFYGKQYLINRMLDYEMLYIEESFVTAISENPPETTADFEERIKNAIAAECICGFSIADGKATLSTPAAGDEPERWKAYVHLWSAILRTAETASRINLKRVDDSENEKYHANSWLMRMDFGGEDYKETRRILMGHLTGFAAFKSAADMEAHKERQAQRRRERREEAQE